MDDSQSSDEEPLIVKIPVKKQLIKKARVVDTEVRGSRLSHLLPSFMDLANPCIICSSPSPSPTVICASR